MTSITIIAVIICAAVATRSNVHNEIAIKLEPRMMINAGKKQKMLMLTLTISIRVSSLHLQCFKHKCKPNLFQNALEAPRALVRHSVAPFPHIQDNDYGLRVGDGVPISSDYHQDGMHSADGHGKSRPDNNTGYPKP